MNSTASGPTPSERGADVGARAEDLRFLHAEIGRLRAEVVALTATQRVLLGQSAYSTRRTIADTDSQRIEKQLQTAFPEHRLPADPTRLASRLLWFEAATGAHVQADAESFAIWVATALVLGEGPRLLLSGPASDTAAEAVAEALAGFGNTIEVVVAEADADPTPRLGRGALDGRLTITRTDVVAGADAAAAIVYGADYATRLGQLVAESDPPAIITVTSDDLRHDETHHEKLLVDADRYVVTLAWRSTAILARTRTPQ